ncbi:uncharacterized protein LOC120477151 [Pimephales promelas]|uniref:uncharacterized protein LOC120477151 n=1 Tax=Pimephales promelas TaxID=90988 RepID=UPI001955DACE|nr:uncharacterized protein LOC120477151 [Pimephales promelas]
MDRCTRCTEDTVCDPTLYSNVYYVPSVHFMDTPDLPLAPADPCDSEAEDLSDPDDGENEDFVPPRSIDLPPPSKKSRNRNRLVEVSSDLNQTPSPPAKSRKTKWVKKDIPTFTLPEPVFELPESVQTPFLYFKKLFTDRTIVHMTERTDRYSVQRTGTSVNTTAAEMEVFLSVLLYVGVFEFPSSEDYWASLRVTLPTSG